MENISDSHRVITDTSDTKPDAGRSIIDKGRTFLRKAGQGLEKAGQSMKEVDTSETQEKLDKFAEDAERAGLDMDLMGTGWLVFGPEGVAPFLENEAIGTGLALVGVVAEGESEMEEGVEYSSHFLGKGIKTAGKTIEHLSKKPTEHGNDIIENYETAAGLASLAYDKKADKRDNVTLQGRTYERDKEFSNQNNAVDVWKEINSKEGTKPALYIAMKGTNPKHMKDLYYDWHIFKDSTESTDMYKEYDRLTKAVFDKYGDTHKIHMTGHSKSGNVISKLSCVYHPESAITFNKGAVPWESSCEGRKTHVHNFTTGYELISAATYFPRKKESTHFITTKKGVSLLDPTYFHNMDHFKK